MGFEGDILYKKSFNKAVQSFNDLIRKTLREVDVVDRDYFSDGVASFRESIENFHEDCEIICRKYPVLIYRKDNKMIGIVDHWMKASYEYNEYDIETERIVLEEIEVVD